MSSNKRISELTLLAGIDIASTDLLVVVDLSATVQERTKKTTVADLATAIGSVGGIYQPIDATLTALAAQNWVNNSIPVGSGADTVAQLVVSSNTFPARASTGSVAAKIITDFALTLVDDATKLEAQTTLGIVPGGTYAGQSLKVLRVNAGETALELATPSGGGGSGAWGGITGNLSDQTDLQAALDARQPLDAALIALAAGSDFVRFAGPASSVKVFTLPDASSTLLYSGGPLGTPSSGVGTNLTGMAASLTAGLATALANVRTIGGSNFDGSANVTSFPSPGAIGGSTPAAGTFTALTGTSGSVTGLTALAVRDTSAAFDLTIASTSSTAFTAGRTLTLDLVNAARTLKISGNPTIADWFDQAVKAGSSPTFVTVTAALAGNAATASAVAVGGITGLGTGVATALAVNVGSAGAFVTFNGALGTPSSGTLTNCTFPTLNQNTSGSAASLSVSGQTGLMTVTGLASTSRIKTVRDAADTILELGGSYMPTGTWTSLTLVTPTLGTPASGTLTSCTGLPVAGITASTSTALGVGSVELGHATDTSVTRSGVGKIAVEGKAVPLMSGAFDAVFAGPTATRTYTFPDADTIFSASPTAANPTASVGLSAINGSASTFLRSDGAPALDVTIAPTWSGAHTHSKNSAASTPTISTTGTWFSGGSATTTKPHVLVEYSGATSTGWSTAGTALGVNADGTFVGRLVDLQTNGTSVFRVTYEGRTNIAVSTASVNAFTVVQSATSGSQSAGTFIAAGSGATINQALQISASGGTTNKALVITGPSAATNDRAISVTATAISEFAADIQITTVGTGSTSAVTCGGTQTFTGKTMIATTNVVEEITSTTSSATPTPTGGSLRNFYFLTAQAATGTFAAPSGSPVNGNILTIRVKASGTQTLAWNAIYRAIGVTLPLSIADTKTIYLTFRYCSADSKWDCLAVATEA